MTHPEVTVQGMLLTLKLLDWAMADEIPKHSARIRSWGFIHAERGSCAQSAGGLRGSDEETERQLTECYSSPVSAIQERFW